MVLPERPTSAIAWELRSCWALGRTVVLVLDRDHTVVPRVGGRIVEVAASDAYVRVDDGLGDAIHVPLVVVLAVRRRHFHEPVDSLVDLPGRDDPPLAGQMLLNGADLW
jgi:hypothetical protein